MTLYNHKSDRFRKKNLSCLTAHRLTPHYRCQDRLIETLSHVLNSIRTWACFGVLTKICVNNIISATIFFSLKRKSHGYVTNKATEIPIEWLFSVYVIYMYMLHFQSKISPDYQIPISRYLPYTIMYHNFMHPKFPVDQDSSYLVPVDQHKTGIFVFGIEYFLQRRIFTFLGS